MIKLNNSPVRTSRNFRINNIELESVEMPVSRLDRFDGACVTGGHCEFVDCRPDCDLRFGLGDVASGCVRDYCNYCAKVIVDEADDVCVCFDCDDDNLHLIDYLEIEALADCNVEIIYNSKTDKKCFHNGILKVNAKCNSKVNVSFVNLLNDSSVNLYAIETNIEDGADVKFTVIDLGAKYSISNYYSNIAGTGAKCDLRTVYLGTENQVKDINYIAEMYGKNTDINIDVQGALKNNSKKNFKGTIDFKKGCKKAVGNENEYCMLLSGDSKSIALPMLLCEEDDVEGNHSTASGKVDEKQLFYIMSRGLEYNEAVKLIVKARFNEIVDRITDLKLQERIINEIDRRLD